MGSGLAQGCGVKPSRPLIGQERRGPVTLRQTAQLAEGSSRTHSWVDPPSGGRVLWGTGSSGGQGPLGDGSSRGSFRGTGPLGDGSSRGSSRGQGPPGGPSGGALEDCRGSCVALCVCVCVCVLSDLCSIVLCVCVCVCVIRLV